MRIIRLNITLVLLTISLSSVFAQEKEGNWWIFGGELVDRNMTFMNFDYGNPLLIPKTKTYVLNASNATISDENGKLVLYFDGDTIWNGNYEVVDNGTGILLPVVNTSSVHPSLIVKCPNKDSKYYLICAKRYDYYALKGGQLGYCAMNMNMFNGKGGVVSGEKNITLKTDMALSLSLHQHANSEDYWVVGHGLKNNCFHIYKLDSTGFQYHDSIVIGTDFAEQESLQNSRMKSSPNSELLAVSIYKMGGLKNIELYKFNRQTGDLFDMITINRGFFAPPHPGAFSASGRFFYTSNSDSVFQYDLSVWDSTAIAQSKFFLGVSGEGAQMADMQLALDGELYFILTPNSPWLGSISCPEVKGTGAGFVAKAVQLYHPAGVFLPTLNQTLFVNAGKLQAQAPNRGHICKGDSVRLSAYGGSMSSWVWSPAAGLSDPLSQNPTLLTDTTATYRVVGTSGCSGATDTAYVTVTVHEPPILPTLPSHVCAGEQFTAQVQNSESGLTYQWKVTGGKPSPTTGTSTTITAGAGPDSLRLSVYAPLGKSCAGDTLRATVAVGYKAKIKTTDPADTCRYEDTLKITYTTGSNPGSTYLWQLTDPGGQIDTLSTDTLATATLTAHGTYKIRLTETRSGCMERDSVSITVKEVPVPTITAQGFTIINDSITACQGDNIVLGTQNYVNLLWNGTTNVLTINPDTTGTYTLQVWQNGCTGADTLKVKIHEPGPKLTLTGPKSVCPGSVDVPYLVSPQGIAYTSNIGSLKNDTVFLTIPEKQDSVFQIYVYATGYHTACTDTATLSIKSDSSFSAAPITGLASLCTGDTGMYSISTYPGATHKWNIIQVTTPVATLQDTSGTGNSLITSAQGTIRLYQTETRKTSVMTCVSNSDTLPVPIKTNPAPEILADNQLLDSLNACASTPVVLSTQSFDSLRWNAESIASELSAETPGGYTLQVWQNGCTGADTFTLSHTTLQTPQFIGYCRTARYELLLANPDPEAIYLLNGDTGTTFIITSPQKTLLKSIKGPCTIDTEVSVTAEDLKACPWDIPNIITPNGDGANDYFEPKIIGPAILKIYDRWGKEVYSNNDYSNEFKATGLSDGVYYYRLSGEYGEARGWVEVRR